MSSARLLAVAALAAALACEPAKPPAPSTSVAPPPAANLDVEAHGDACRTDIPDCEAACALRETHRTEHLDWFDRRCAAVVLGRNPDKAVGYQVPDVQPDSSAAAVAPPSSSLPSTAPPLPTSRQLPPVDPFSARGNRPEPSECSAARTLRAQGRAREADVLAALCAAKGGSETKNPMDPDLGF